MPKALSHSILAPISKLASGGSRISQTGAPILEGGAPTYYLANFSRKLHENEDILGQSAGGGWGGTRPSRPT